MTTFYKPLMTCALFLALLLAIVACSPAGFIQPEACKSDTDCAQGQSCLFSNCVVKTQLTGTVARSEYTSHPEGNQSKEGIVGDAGPDSTEQPPACKEGTTRECYTGPEDTKGKGECKAGKQICEGGAWSSCTGEQLPQPELCNGKDDDCDGTIDKELTQECYEGPQKTAGVGSCKKGVKTCNNGRWTSCKDDVRPTDEECNGKDDDCDGKIDDFKQPCFDGKVGCTQTPQGFQCVGNCKTGEKHCKEGSWSSCKEQISPTQSQQDGREEHCDGKDDNCDGKVDEGCTCQTGAKQACGDSTGECKKGNQLCNKDGMWGDCQGGVDKKPELCNGKDDNCDGQIDENYPKLQQECTVGLGSCENKGKYQCKQDGSDVECPATPLPSSPEECNGKDDDCDGSVDEDWNLGAPCTNGHGVCERSGKTICDPQDPKNPKTVCDAPIVSPPTNATEECNGKDDDCDGNIDNQKNTRTPITKPCYENKLGTSLGKGCTSNTDNNGNVTYSCVGTCNTGTRLCRNGQWSICQGAIAPKPEDCNGLDDDCNGQIDENLKRTGYPERTPGCKQDTTTGKWSCTGTCNTGTQICQNARWLFDPNDKGSQPIKPIPEICRNLLDDNCNGQTDEICGSPAIPYLVMDSQGKVRHSRGLDLNGNNILGGYHIIKPIPFSVKLPNNGTASYSQSTCASSVAFVTPSSGAAHPISYFCNNTSDFKVYLGAITGNTDLSSFHMVVANRNSGGVWGMTNGYYNNYSGSNAACATGRDCPLARIYPNTSARVRRIGTGEYEIISNACRDRHPFFASIYERSAPNRIYTSIENSGPTVKCKVYITNLRNQLVNHQFAFWFPAGSNSNSLTAWAVGQETPIKTNQGILNSNQFGLSNPSWIVGLNPNVTNQYNVGYEGWLSSPNDGSAIIAMPLLSSSPLLGNRALHTSIDGTTSNGARLGFFYTSITTLPVTTRAKTNFSVLFAQ